MQASSTKMLRRAGMRAVHGTAAGRVVQPVRPTAAATRRVRVQAASTEPAVAEEQRIATAQAPQTSALASFSSDPEVAEMELAELDAAQEQVLTWMLNHTEQQHEEDLDEMVDYDEFGDEEYAEIQDQVEQMIDASYSTLTMGDQVKGTVYEVDDDGAYIEIGEKASGFVPLSECSFAKLKSAREALRVGMTRDFVVVGRDDDTSQLVLSLAVQEASLMWARMQYMLSEEVAVKVKVDSANRGGLLVKYGPFDGFVPVGQFGQSITVENMESLVGQEIPVMFLEVNEEGERLVFSNKRVGGVALADSGNLKVGDVVVGVVQDIKLYGVFVDIGGMTGLLHVSQVTSGRLLSIDKVFSVGDKIKVMILSLDKERSRITLSTKKLEPHAGDMLTNPMLVYEKAEEMAAVFRERLDQATQQLQYVEMNAGTPEGQQPMSTTY